MVEKAGKSFKSFVEKNRWAVPSAEAEKKTIATDMRPPQLFVSCPQSEAGDSEALQESLESFFEDKDYADCE
jgi:hypothetical protein